MAATLFCRNLVSQPNLHRSLLSQAKQMVVSWPKLHRSLLCQASQVRFIRPNLHRSLLCQASLMECFPQPNLYRSLSCEAPQIWPVSQNYLGNHARPFPMPYDDQDRIRWEDELMEFYRRYDYESDDTSEWSTIKLKYNKPKTPRVVVLGTKPPEPSTCHYLIRHFFRHHNQRIAMSFLAQMLIYGAIPNLSIFSLLAKSYLKHLTYQQLLDLVLIQMKALEVEGSYSFYKFLIGRVCIRFGPIFGYQLLKKLRSSYRVQMPVPCYSAIVDQFCKTKKLDDESMVLVLIDVLMDMKKEKIFPDEIIFNRLRKGRGCGSEAFLKALALGSQMFSKGIRIGEVYTAT